MIHIYLLSFDSICSIGYCGTSYGAEISFDVWRRLGWSSSVFPATKIFAISRNSLLGLPFPVTSPTALRLLTSNPAGLSLPNQREETCKFICLSKVLKKLYHKAAIHCISFAWLINLLKTKSPTSSISLSTRDTFLKAIMRDVKPSQ